MPSSFKLQDLWDVEIQTGIHMFFSVLFKGVNNDKIISEYYLQNNRPIGSLEDLIW